MIGNTDRVKGYCFLLVQVLLFFCGSCYAVEISVEGDAWQVKAKLYEITSKNGYLNSLTVEGSEFLGQQKVPGGSYLAAGNTLRLQAIEKIGESSISGSNSLGELRYQFTAQDIVCTYHNKTDKDVVYYFILHQDVTTVIVNHAEMLELPAKSRGDVFKWVKGEDSLEFQGVASIWGPWQEHQVFQIRVAPGETRRVKIVPGKILDTKGFNQNKQAGGEQLTEFDFRASVQTKQIPLCMIGDSITWAGNGDHWRKSLLKRLPNLAFVGNHTAKLGYSHAGEGGDATSSVLSRIKYLPDCPYYSLLIGTNNNGVKESELVLPQAGKTAEDVIRIVKALLLKKKVEKVFLSSLLPCFTKNPLRDQCNSETNRILRAQFKEVFPSGKVVWVEYEKPIRAWSGWEEKIRLHPSLEGYDFLADILAKAIATELPDKGDKLLKVKNTGVQVVNLLGEEQDTKGDIVAGWYTLSFKVDTIHGEGAQLALRSSNDGVRFPFQLKIDVTAKNQKLTHHFFTQYERYNYSKAPMKLEALGCEISEVLLEKTRPSMKASTYGRGTYIDSISPMMPGELLEFIK